MPLDPQIDTQLTEAHHRIKILQRENAKLSACSAAMRIQLLKVYECCCDAAEWDSIDADAVKSAISPECGKDLLRQLNGAYEEVTRIGELAGHSPVMSYPVINTVKEKMAKLAAFEAAMERERKPDWEKWNKDLANKLREIANEVFEKSERNDLQTAARQLDYFTDSFTLKANFVPNELRIKELEGLLRETRSMHLRTEANRDWLDRRNAALCHLSNERLGIGGEKKITT